MSQTDRVSREKVLTAETPGDRASRAARQSRSDPSPLYTSACENDLRACITKRRISDSTMSAADRQVRDVMLGLMKTCRKLGISFFAYLGDRLGLSGTGERIPPLPDLVGVPPA
ncbi:hypothetical protein GCM10011402_32180 [Paracoccus acridae]|uniref:Uncharacterized protein n=1 Tax=Paracoccus acridae TaxID=1795310 RepID=A0ABQ1VLB5_9RHOB|nr:hypothetical protein [Paracoccus acridae]GGF77052.1 hypothetical protein GCM10011402_32180 [Paracoccus acridae]